MENFRGNSRVPGELTLVVCKFFNNVNTFADIIVKCEYVKNELYDLVKDLKEPEATDIVIKTIAEELEDLNRLNNEDAVIELRDILISGLMAYVDTFQEMLTVIVSVMTVAAFRHMELIAKEVENG